MSIIPILCHICTHFYIDWDEKLIENGSEEDKHIEILLPSKNCSEDECIVMTTEDSLLPFKMMKCSAFPDGISEDILLSKFIHFEKHPDQKNDIVFEATNSDFPCVSSDLHYFKEMYERQKKEKNK